MVFLFYQKIQKSVDGNNLQIFNLNKDELNIVCKRQIDWIFANRKYSKLGGNYLKLINNSDV